MIWEFLLLLKVLEKLYLTIFKLLFLPFIVYIVDAINTQTETIYIRDLKTGRAKFSNYLQKELLLSLIFGLIFGIISGGIAYIWLKNSLLSMTVFISSFIVIFSAPLVALIIPQIFLYLRNDPAAGSGPIATVIQDMLSVIIYGTTASIIIL